MFATAIARMRAAVAALRGRLPVAPTVPVRPSVPALPDMTAVLARVAEMQAAAATHKKLLDGLAADLSGAAQRKPG